MSPFDHLPLDILHEIVLKSSYADVIKLCQTHKRISTFCQHAHQMLDNKLYDELSQKSLNKALIVASYYNNTNVFLRLIKEGADPLADSEFNSILDNIVSNKNYTLLKLLLQAVEVRSDKTKKNEILSKALPAFFIFLINDYYQYLTASYLLRLVKSGTPIVENILKHLNELNFGKLNQQDFILILYLYTLAYQPNALLAMIEFLQKHPDFTNYLTRKNIKNLLHYDNKLFTELVKYYKISISLYPLALKAFIPQYNYSGMTMNLTEQSRLERQAFLDQVIDDVAIAVTKQLKSLIHFNPISFAIHAAKAGRKGK